MCFRPFSKHDILMSALARFKQPLTIVSSRDVSSTIFWRCKLKPPQNGKLKKRIIDLSRTIIHMTYLHDLYILKVFSIPTKTLNVTGKNLLIQKVYNLGNERR